MTFDIIDIIAGFCLFYHIPVCDYDRVLNMSHRWFFAMLEYKNKVLKAESEALKRGNTR